MNAAGVVVEQGDAVIQENGLDWVYTATVQNDVVEGSVVRESAMDLTANKGVSEVVVV